MRLVVFVADTDEEAWKLSVESMMGRMMGGRTTGRMMGGGVTGRISGVPDLPEKGACTAISSEPSKASFLDQAG